MRMCKQVCSSELYLDRVLGVDLLEVIGVDVSREGERRSVAHKSLQFSAGVVLRHRR